MPTQQRKRNGKNGTTDRKAKRKRNAKRGEASKREGFPGRRVPSGSLSNDQRDVADAVTERTSNMVTQPSTVRQRDQRNVNARGE